jgi:hypothetical protein
METQAVITDWRGMCVHAGLGKPWCRALTAALLFGAGSYALKMPRSRYDERGRANSGFFLVPLTAAALTYALT